MIRSVILSRLSATALLLALAGCGSNSPDPAPTPPVTAEPVLAAGLGAGNIAGLNWADPRDNFVDDALVLSGLQAGDTYATVQTKSAKIIGGLQGSTGANTVRLPINPATATGATWEAYTGAIDQALAKNMKVILACWESSSRRDGRVDDPAQFISMWQTVVGKYGTNPKVYFEVFNEPYGYSLAELGTLYADWLSRFPAVPQNRVLLGGTGYSEDLTRLGTDSRFSNCLLSLHLYDFFYGSPATTAAGWEAVFASKLGNNASRTVFTEWGAFMTTGVNYYSAIDNDVKKAYVLGVSNYCRQHNIASVYWPGLRSGDQYSLLQFDGTNTTVTNGSGLGRVQFAWGEGLGGTNQLFPNAYYRLINRSSGQVADVNGASKQPMAPVVQWYSNGAVNQQWQLTSAGSYYTLKNRNSGQLLDVATTMVVQNPDNSAPTQQWQLTANEVGYYTLKNRSTSQVLDGSGASTTTAAGVMQAAGTNSAGQQWLVWQQ
ncbi:RICIN domain-containing protein [Hymenobacter pini]|uniref:RICIN domain-containing protein n=1 Tax=Hymenobacter pini TaxID=2880879 RepID=UPI001CF17035|nr:RICIN domain-containing protein [Hymenobacter pini]MCA8829570.1 RICIN domain-containing protein [Hymenobacter pini]